MHISRKRKQRSGWMIPSLLLLLLLCFLNFLNKPIAYTVDEEYLSSLQSLTESDIELFASDLAIIAKEDTEVGFTADSGFSASTSGGEALFSKSAMQQMHPASTTKILTALVALEHGNLADIVTVGEEVVIGEAGASMAGLMPGDMLRLEDLLYGLMLPSGNDAAAAIAVHIAGSIEEFAKLMNEKAYILGARDSHFTNPHGLTDEAHYTSAYDLYLIFHEALQYPKFIEIAGSKDYQVSYTSADGSQVSKIWKNGNQYLTQGVNAPTGIEVFAGKTGTTGAAGSCLVVSSKKEDGETYISVVLKAGNKSLLYENMNLLLQKEIE